MNGCAGIKVINKHVDFDYSPYLGPGYLKSHSSIKQAPTLVCNHISFYDNWVLCLNLSANFIVDDIFKNMPFIGKLYKICGSIFVNIVNGAS